MSKFYDKKVAEIQALMAQAKEKIDPAVAGNPSITMDDYSKNFRIPINTRMIELALGGEFTQKKKKETWTIKYNHKLMTAAETAKLYEMLADFMRDIEYPALNAWVPQVAANADDDMSIPAEGTASTKIQILEKVNAKKLTEAVLGKSGQSYSLMWLQPADLAMITANADALRKRNNKIAMIVAGGIILVAGGAIATGAVIHHNKSKKADEALMDEINDINGDTDLDDDVDLDGPGSVDLDGPGDADLDTPSVTLD
jgi:hypothetical protein